MRKSLTYFGNYDYSQNPFTNLEQMALRMEVATDVLNDLKEKGEMSGKDLDNAVELLMGERGFSIRPFVESLPEVSEEIRAEEYIEIQMKEYTYGRIFRTHDANTIIFQESSHYSNPTYLVFNPQFKNLETNKFAECGYVRGTRMVQVKRKYYRWIG